MKEPIENHKAVCQGMAPTGWNYGGFDDEHYIFLKGNYAEGFKEMLCEEQDLIKDNLALMAKLGVTR